MVFEMALLLCLGQQDTLSQANFLYHDASAEAGIYDSWESLIDARKVANLAGFGSVSSQLEDGQYALEYVFFGSNTTINSQLDRLNQIIGSNLKLKEAYQEPRRSNTNDEGSKTVNAAKHDGYQINVSSGFEKTKISSETTDLQADIKVDQEVPEIDTVDIQKIAPMEINQIISTNAFSSIQETLSEETEVLEVDIKPKDRQLVNDKMEVRLNESKAPKYAIVFGSFKKLTNAEDFSQDLRDQKIQVVILDSGGYYRVLIPFEEYPSQEIKKYHELFPRSWLLRND